MTPGGASSPRGSGRDREEGTGYWGEQGGRSRGRGKEGGREGLEGQGEGTREEGG